MRSKISLLPESYKKKNKMVKTLYIVTAVTVSFSLIIGVIFSFVVMYRIGLNTELASIKAQRLGIQASIDSMKSAQEISEKVSNIETLIKNIENTAYDWEAFFKKTSALIPGGVSLTSFSAKGSKDKVEIQYQGTASDSYRVAYFLSFLKSMPELNEIILTSSNQVKVLSNTFYNFSIKGSLKIDDKNKAKPTPKP